MTRRLIVIFCLLVLIVGLAGLRHGPDRDPRSGQQAGLSEAEKADRHARERTMSGAMASLRMFASQRSYPGRSLPAHGYAEAFADVKKRLREASSAKQGETAWRPLGPHNIGGRTLALAFNPQNPHTIYAGSASGGLWRSTTAGVGAQAWQYVPMGHPVLGVGAIAIAPDDSNVIYIGTGEVYSYWATQGGIAVRLTRGSFGIGILKSVDGGRSWFKSLDWSYAQQRGVQAIRLDPTDPDVVWACTTEGVFRSDDAGGTWSQVLGVVMATDLAIHGGDPDIVIAACGNLSSSNVGLYRTSDGGLHWDRIVQPGVIPTLYNGKALLSISRSDPDIIMASIGNGTEVPVGGTGDNFTWLLRSEDAGVTWSVVSTMDYSRWQGWFAHDLAIHPDHPDTVITAGIDIYRSFEAGANLERRSVWSRGYGGQVQPGESEGPPEFSHADHHDIVFHPTDHDTVYFANDGGIFRSLDCGGTFEGCNGGYQTTQFYAGFSSSRNDSALTMGGMQDNGTAFSDGSVAWIHATGGDGGWTGIDPTDDRILYSSAQSLVLFKSIDGGLNWQNITPPDVGGQIGFIAPFTVGGPDQPELIYAGSSLILKSADGGESWRYANLGIQLDGNPTLAIAVAPTNSDVLAVTTAPVYSRAGIFYSSNAGAGFRNVTGDLPDRYPVGLAFDPVDSQTFYVTFSGFGTSHLYRTRDGGDSWQDIGADLPDVPTSAVIVDPDYPDQIYVGNDLGVFVSTDDGRSWGEFRSGLLDAVVGMDLTIHPGSRMLRVSTYGNGVFERPLLPEQQDGPGTEVPGPAIIALDQNVPNPFNAGTDITYTVERGGDVKLEILTIRGARVATLVDDHRDADVYTIRWNGRRDDGRGLASGVYLCRLEAHDQAETLKMQLVR